MTNRSTASGGMTKVAWVVNHYAPFLSKDGWSGLHVEIARALKTSSWQVNVIAASTSHPSGRQHAPTKGAIAAVSEGGASSYWLHAPEYSGNGWGRIRNMAVFGLRLLSSAGACFSTCLHSSEPIDPPAPVTSTRLPAI